MKFTQGFFLRQYLKFYLSIFFLVCHFQIQECAAQTLNFYDSLNFAKEKLNEGKIKEALEILEILEKRNPGEENVIRVKGQAFYWSKDFDQTKSYFRESIQTYPSLLWIKLDYGRILFELNELSESAKILEEFLVFEPHHPEALQKLAAISYWRGGKPHHSISYLDRILSIYPENKDAHNLKQEIRQNTSPRFGFRSGYYSDTQILQYLGLQSKVEFYQSAKLQPHFSFEFRNYQNGQSAVIAQTGLKSSFVKTKTDLFLKAGLVNSRLWNNHELTYGAEVHQKLPSNFQITAALDREYYLFTLASLGQPINPLTFRGSFGRETGEGWIGKVLFQKSVFQDENWVQTLSAWFMIPVLNSHIAQLSLGSAGNFSDSKEVRFSENLPIKNQQVSTPLDTVIPGSYTPYFTPINQKIIGGLGKLNFSFTPTFNLSFTGNVGLFAQIENPNMIYYGTTPGQGVGQGNRPISPDDIYLVLVDQKFTPIDFKTEINWEISPKTAVTTSYAYQETVFFHSHQINLHLKMSIWNER